MSVGFLLSLRVFLLDREQYVWRGHGRNQFFNRKTGYLILNALYIYNYQ